MIRIYYYFETVKVNDMIKQEVDRIFQDAVNTKGGKKHTLKVEWEEVADKKSYDAKPFGWVGGGWFHNCPDGVNLGMRDTLNMGQVPGQAGHFKANMNPTVIKDSAMEAKVSFDIAVARVIAHELGLHGIATSGHYHDEGWIDADKGGQLTGKGVFSPEAAQAICDQLDIEEGD